jgi:hypothetical protein
MMDSEFHNGLRNPGLYSLISHKSAAVIVLFINVFRKEESSLKLGLQ